MCGGKIYCVDTLKVGSLEALMPALTAPHTRKLIHAARQDLEALYLSSKQVLTPVFDTQIAAACVGLKPQMGYAELVLTLLQVTVPKGQTRTDWSKRPLTRDQLDYAADDVLYLGDIDAQLSQRLIELGANIGSREDCAAIEDKRCMSRIPRSPGSACAASLNCRRRRAHAPKPLPIGVRSSPAAVICLVPGFWPTRRCFRSRKEIRPAARPWSEFSP